MNVKISFGVILREGQVNGLYKQLEVIQLVKIWYLTKFYKVCLNIFKIINKLTLDKWTFEFEIRHYLLKLPLH